MPFCKLENGNTILWIPDSQISRFTDSWIQTFRGSHISWFIDAGDSNGRTLRCQPEPCPRAPMDQIRREEPRAKSPCYDFGMCESLRALFWGQEGLRNDVEPFGFVVSKYEPLLSHADRFRTNSMAFEIEHCKTHCLGCKKTRQRRCLSTASTAQAQMT